MTACKYLKSCPFFNDKMANMPGTANMFKNQYCKQNFSECARFIIREKLGPGSVPVDLFPNNAHRVPQLLAHG